MKENTLYIVNTNGGMQHDYEPGTLVELVTPLQEEDSAFKFTDGDGFEQYLAPGQVEEVGEI